MLQMGKLIRQMRKQQKMTQKVLAEGIVSESVMSRIENGSVNPGLTVLRDLFGRLGISLQPFELVVSNKEYEEWKQSSENFNMQTIIIAEGDYVKDIREAMGLSQEQFSSDIYARETISNIEHGQTPQRKKIQTVLEKQGMSLKIYHGYVETAEYNVYEWVERYQRLFAEEAEEATEWLKKIRETLNRSFPVNRQFLESSELMEKRRNGGITAGEELAALENCLRYTMPEYDGGIYRMSYRQETVILWEIVRCMKDLCRTEAAELLTEEIRKKNGKKLKLS